MSVKTCQLCGKPLGRRGSDGEFCSKEHRNQSQLRRGLDRLEEADKVATLMRRRENPRPIPAEQLMTPGTCEARATTESAPYPARQQELRIQPLQAALFQPRIARHEDRFSNPLSELTRRSGVPATRLATPASLPFVARRTTPALEPQNSTKPAAGVVRASSTPIRCHVAATKGDARECGAALRMARRPVAPRRLTAPLAAAAGTLEKSRQFQALTLAALGAGTGEIKIHAGRTFAKRSLVLRAEPRSLRLQGGLPESQMQPYGRPETQALPPVSRACEIPRTVAMPRFPELRISIEVSGTRAAGVSPMRPAAYGPAEPADPRSHSISWAAAGVVALPGLRRITFRAGLDQAGRPLTLHAACNAAREHRPAEVSFAPADSPFEPPPMILQGVFPPNGSERARASLDVIEEHFDAGLEQWAGDTVDWKLDAAGARPAGLALFRPTLSLGDYEFEFFTRIESRAVTYAFRAANVSNYLKVTIAMVESGRYELRQCAVIGGIEEPGVASPLPGVLRPGAAFTVKTRALQNDFTIWLDGELAARWTDGRLPTGGIGFLAPRDDRARVYWVRLSQVEGPNSQAGTHRTVRSIQ